MKLNRKIEKLVETNNLGTVVSGILNTTELEKLLLEMSNQCVFKANPEKNKRRKRDLFNAARVLHRAYDEIVIEKTKKVIFKISRRDIYECQNQKCKKRFRVDAGKEQNCKFDLDKSMIVVTCPNCGRTE